MFAHLRSALPARRVFPLCGALGLIMFGAGCADKRGGAFAYNPSNFGAPDAPKVAALGSGYKIAPLDTLTIKVFKMPDLSGDYEVDLTGQISLPLIGDVTATNYTTAQLDEELTRKLGAKYLENPDISVGVKSSTSRSVTVDGAVNKAGAFPANGPVTLMQAVAQAGGATPEANLRRVAIFRQIELQASRRGLRSHGNSPRRDGRPAGLSRGHHHRRWLVDQGVAEEHSRGNSARQHVRSVLIRISCRHPSSRGK